MTDLTPRDETDAGTEDTGTNRDESGAESPHASTEGSPEGRAETAAESAKGRKRPAARRAPRARRGSGSTSGAQAGADTGPTGEPAASGEAIDSGPEDGAGVAESPTPIDTALPSEMYEPEAAAIADALAVAPLSIVDTSDDDDSESAEEPGGSDEDEIGDRASRAAGADDDIVELDSDAREAQGDGREGRRHGRRDRQDRFGRRERRARDTHDSDDRGQHRAPRQPRKQLMLVNDLPDEECRVALLEDGRLEALFIEREGTATNVGNIYKGRVTNVEPAIQAAFVDFGEGQSGFLHISDLHPKYFPGEERTERVGRKIPRRERPLIQQALRKGQEVVVQVLKEGLGSKGPTLTSYLSIPGRLMVMMPDMDRVGVSRKVEDEDQRRAMRKILDQLDLPDGFGFILRTAGFDRTKTELSRDLAYLKRLWDVMQRRSNSTGAPCMLYSEGDLLIRTIRDLADENVEAIVVDSEEAYRKASAFLQVVAPRSASTLRFWSKTTAAGDAAVPLFHAFDVERQVAQLHSREVPLPSGGALVIDQAEALVAIDVNSGRSRAARDSETNAYQTNVEAVEEIARQLRLRDLGGVIVNDLIDMRLPKHRRDIEDRFRAALRRDRAKSTTLPISEFGVIEMTRQRMRPSVRKTHFMDCPHCHGLGEVMMPETVAADHLREIEFLCSFDKVRRVEVVCSVRVASVLLSTKRRALYEIEATTRRRIDVRISEAIPIDRVDLYAYDDRGSDVEISRLPRPSRPDLGSIPTVPPVREDFDDDEDEIEPSGGGRRRRRRRRKPAPADTTAMIMGGHFDDLPDAQPTEGEPTIAEAIEAERAARRGEAATGRGPSDGEGTADAAADGEGGRRRRRRRRRRGRGGDDETDVAHATPTQAGAAPEPEAPAPTPSEPTLVHVLAKELGCPSKDLLARCAEAGIEVKSHMTKLTGEQVDLVRSWFAPPPPPPRAPAPRTAAEPRADGAGAAGETLEGEGEGRRRRRRRRRRGRGGETGGAPGAPPAKPADVGSAASAQRGAERPRPIEPQRQQHAGAASDGDGASGEGGRGRRGRRRRRRGRGGDGAPQQSRDGQPARAEPQGPASQPSPARAASTGASPPPAPTPAAPVRRSLYGGRFRKLGSSEIGGTGGGGRDDE